MKANMQPFNVWIISPDKNTLRFLKPTLTHDIMEGNTQLPHPDGLFSTEIYGRVGDPSRDSVFSYIPLGAKILHPLIFRTLGRIKSLYRDILFGTRFATWDDVNKDFVASNPIEGKTGYQFFMSHYPDIVFTLTGSDARARRVELLNKYRMEAITSNILVIPAGLRDVDINPEDGRITQDEINDYYRTLLSVSNVFKGVEGNSDDPIFDASRRSAQIAFNSIYDYLEKMISGKRGLIQSKWASRNVYNSTRNVITAMDTSADYLGGPRSVQPTMTQVGLFQLAKSVLPITLFELRNGFLSTVFSGTGNDIRLVDPKTLESKVVNVGIDTLDKWETTEGLETLLNQFGKKSFRLKPVKIEGHYLGLVYRDGTSFRIFQDIRDLPEHLSKDNVHPLTLAELIYLSCYQRFKNLYGMATRYPITGDGSIYPCQLYCLTTQTSSIKLPLDENWEKMDEFYQCLEYPDIEGGVWINTMLPSLIRLQGLGADFD